MRAGEKSSEGGLVKLMEDIDSAIRLLKDVQGDRKKDIYHTRGHIQEAVKILEAIDFRPLEKSSPMEGGAELVAKPKLFLIEVEMEVFADLTSYPECWICEKNIPARSTHPRIAFKGSNSWMDVCNECVKALEKSSASEQKAMTTKYCYSCRREIHSLGWATHCTGKEHIRLSKERIARILRQSNPERFKLAPPAEDDPVTT